MVSIAPKLYSLIAMAVLALASPCTADQLQIADLKGRYAANAPIQFTLVKQAPGTLTVAIASEVLWEGKFRADRWDIFGNGLKMVVRR